MAQKVTIKDIAAKAGTSVTSVHRALYGRKGISDDLRTKILTEVEDSNYRMDEAASLLRRGQFHITVLLPKPEGQERFYYRGLWDGIYRGTEEIRKNKVKITFVEASRGVNHISEALEHLYDETDESLHGLITICDDDEAKGWIQRFIRRGTKVALVDRGTDIENICCCMETSSSDMGHLAVNMMEFLMEKKEEGSLILVNGPKHRGSYRTYATAVKERITGIHPDMKVIIIDGYEEQEGRETLKKLLKEEKIKGIIASCARATYWVCDAVEKMQLEAPPPIVGTDVFEELKPFFDSGVLQASIYQSHCEHGEKALRYLYESLKNPHREHEEKQLATLSMVMKENYKYFL